MPILTDVNIRTLECSTNWNIVVNSKKELVFQFDLIKFNDEELSNMRIRFTNPREEWSLYWDDIKEDWFDHPNPSNPIELISEITAKPVGNQFKVSFGGNHEVGWSRWGFNYNEAELLTK